MKTDAPIVCARKGCGVLRRAVNKWYVVDGDLYGYHLYRWETCPAESMKKGSYFCGLPCALLYISSVESEDATRPDRESTLELKPVKDSGQLSVDSEQSEEQ